MHITSRAWIVTSHPLGAALLNENRRSLRQWAWVMGGPGYTNGVPAHKRVSLWVVRKDEVGRRGLFNSLKDVMSYCSILVGSNASVMTSWLWNLLNIGVSLVGYYLAAFMIDWKWYGRKRMQVGHYLSTFPSCFHRCLCCSQHIIYDGSGIHVADFGDATLHIAHS